MSVNKHRPHLFILPEDDANRQIARGFIEHRTIRHRCVQVRNPAGGWTKALKKFHSDYLGGMRRYRDRHLLFLIDFDQDEKRLDRVRGKIPQDVADRVFVLGTWSEPEALKAKTGKTFEDIGRNLATGCPDSRSELWGDELLTHNDLKDIVSSVGFLFS